MSKPKLALMVEAMIVFGLPAVSAFAADMQIPPAAKADRDAAAVALVAAFMCHGTAIGFSNRPMVLRSIRAISIRPSRTTIMARCEPIRPFGAKLVRRNRI